MRKKINLIKAIIDLIHYKKILEENPKNSLNNWVHREKFEIVNKILYEKYKFLRIANTNPFEIFEAESVLLLDPEIINNFTNYPNEKKTDPKFDVIYNDITENFCEPANISPKKTKFQDLKNPLGFDKKAFPLNHNQQISFKDDSTNNTFNITNIFQENNQYFRIFIENSTIINRKRNFSEFEMFDLNKKANFEGSIDPNNYYHSYKLINNLYNSLLFIGDFDLAIHISEILYTKIQINFNDFFSQEVCEYFKHLRNLQFIHDIESLYFGSQESDHLIPLTNCTFLTQKMSLQIVIFTPIFNAISSLGTPTQNNKKLSEFQEKFQKGDFVKIVSSQSKKNFSFIAKIIKIDSDSRIIFEALLNNQLINLLREEKEIWFMNRMGNFLQSERLSRSLVDFCCGKQILLNFVNHICSSKPDLEEKDFFFKDTTEFQKTNLNQTQNLALRHAINSPLTLVDGPKNSGKTRIAIEVMIEW